MNHCSAIRVALVAGAILACGCSSPSRHARPLPAASSRVDTRVSTERVVATIPTASSMASSTSSPPPAEVELGEPWENDMVDSPPCEHLSDVELPVYQDSYGEKRKFGYDGYVHRSLEISRTIGGAPRRHCVEVYWPSTAEASRAKRPVNVAARIDAAWFRLLERSLIRLPWRHLTQVQRFVIDNRPLLHGIAPFDRQSADGDARDGHTIWLNEELFVGANHWAKGNYGQYWAYHTQQDGVTVDGQRGDHELFSPVLLHEVGHIVNYNLVNGVASDPSCPSCAHMCGDLKACKEMTMQQQQELCATAYCTAFGLSSGTENWAEMYRWYYQGQPTRDLLKKRHPACFALLDGRDGLDRGRVEPWGDGLGQVVEYRKTLWDSCGGKACLDR